MNVNKVWSLAGVLALGLMSGGATYAQDEADDTADSAESGPSAASVKPLPAEILPRTPQSLLLDIQNTGERLIAVGDRGAIIVSNDGKNWAQVEVPVRSALTAVAFADVQHGWAVGHDAAVVATSDGGRTWKLQNYQPELEKPLLGLLVLDAQHVLAVGAYGLMLETRDGGASWEEVDTLGFNEEELHLNSIARLNNGDLFVAGEQGLLAISTDGGASWKRQASPYEGSYFGVLPHGDKGALVYGLRGNVYLARDARSGRWEKIETGTVASMFGGVAVPGDGQVLVGLNGVILLVSGQGKPTLVQAPSGTALSGVLPYGKDLLLAVGESGVQAVKLNTPLQ